MKNNDQQFTLKSLVKPLGIALYRKILLNVVTSSNNYLEDNKTIFAIQKIKIFDLKAQYEAIKEIKEFDSKELINLSLRIERLLANLNKLDYLIYIRKMIFELDELINKLWFKIKKGY